MTILVRGNELTFESKTYRCAIGKAGFADDKKEGDNKTPVGTFLLRECWYRPDRIEAPVTKLPLRTIGRDDGWCDASASNLYNHHVRLPFAASHEKMWREDHAYDIVIPLGYNDDPAIPGKGSAIFMHVALPDWRGTEGCIALRHEDLLELLPKLTITTAITIQA